MTTRDEVLVDPTALREQVQNRYREVAADPSGRFHFHTGRDVARRLGDDDEAVAALPDRAVESFAGVADPVALRPLAPGARVVDVGSSGEGNARACEVCGYPFLARRPVVGRLRAPR